MYLDPAEADYPNEDTYLYWPQYTNDPGGFVPYGSFPWSGLEMHANTYYSGGAWAAFIFTAPPGSYIYALTEQDVGHHADESLEFGGIAQHSGSAWEPGVWQDANGNSGSGADYFAGNALSYDTFVYCVESDCSPNSGIDTGNEAQFGLEQWYSGTQSANPANQGDDDSSVYLSDDVTPSVQVLSHSGYTPGQWVQNVSDTVTAKATVSAGLGVEDMYLDEVPPDEQDSPSSCGSGLPPCPFDPTASFTYDTGDMTEGDHTVWIRATTAGDGASDPNAAAARWQVKIDRTAPTISLSGALASAPSGNITDQPYQLNVSANDATSANEKLRGRLGADRG